MSDENNYGLTRRRVLGSLGVIGIASAGAGAGTMAMFSDTETSDATISAGTLDLTVDDGETFPVERGDVMPGDSGGLTVTLRNAGSVDGEFSVDVENLSDLENGLLEPEQDLGDDGTTGELADHLDVTMSLGGSTYSGVLADFDGPLTADPSGDEVDFTFEWSLATSVGSVVQSDKVTFDFVFTLEQNGSTST